MRPDGAFYLRTAVDGYWIVDPDGRSVERWRPGNAEPELLAFVLRWSREESGAPLAIDLPKLFAEAHGET